IHALEERGGRRLDLRLALLRLLLGLRQHLGDEGTVASGLDDHLVAGLGVGAEHPAVVGGLGEDLARLGWRHLVRGYVVGVRGPLGLWLIVRAVGRRHALLAVY